MDIRIIRSDKRVRTVSARMVDGVFTVRAPQGMSDDELNPVIDSLLERHEKRHRKGELDDEALEARAQALNRSYYGGRLTWTSIRWVSNQNTRHGSCTPANGSIRLSHKLATMPQFVQDYVLMHELAHLLEPNHGKGFWALVNRYPKTERARGYLMAVGLEGLDEEGED